MLIKGIKEYTGLSSDAKPAPERQPEGSTLHIINTGEEYIVHDGTWEPDRRMIYALNAI